MIFRPKLKTPLKSMIDSTWGPLSSPRDRCVCWPWPSLRTLANPWPWSPTLLCRVLHLFFRLEGGPFSTLVSCCVTTFDLERRFASLSNPLCWNPVHVSPCSLVLIPNGLANAVELLKASQFHWRPIKNLPSYDWLHILKTVGGTPPPHISLFLSCLWLPLPLCHNRAVEDTAAEGALPLTCVSKREEFTNGQAISAM